MVTDDGICCEASTAFASTFRLSFQSRSVRRSPNTQIAFNSIFTALFYKYRRNDFFCTCT